VRSQLLGGYLAVLQRKAMLGLQSKIELEGKLKIPGILTARDIGEIRGRWPITRTWRG
jgi:hypothetical protein